MSLFRTIQTIQKYRQTKKGKSIMEINFTTKYVDKKLYQKSMLTYIYDHYLYSDYEKYEIQNKWVINIRPLSEFDWEFYDKSIKNLSTNMPHGVTGDNVIECFVNDEPNIMYYLQNMMVICHELSHMILKIYYPRIRGVINQNDTWGKAGDERNFFSTEVHNRVFEGRTRKLNTYHNRRKFVFYGVDISDLTNQRNLNKGF